MTTCNTTQKRLCDKDDCEICFDRSFASHPKAICWSKDNEQKPREILRCVSKKYLFACNKCNHIFKSALSDVSRGIWCSYCCNPPVKLCDHEGCDTCYQKSFACHPRSLCWSADNNKKPREVFKYDNRRYKFDCNTCLHTFECKLSNISNDRWCPYCANPPKKLCDKYDCNACYQKSFASHLKSEYWSKDNQKKPREVFKHDNKKYKFDCDTCIHSFESVLSSISNGSWCPYCCYPPKKMCDEHNCKHCFEQSFASHQKAVYWSDENDKKPREIFRSSGDKYKFDCIECKHSFEIKLDSINKECWCQYCANKVLCDKDECDTCYQKSFASHPKAVYWSHINTQSPRETFKSSDSKYSFDCKECETVFQATLSSISRGRWCPNCKHKTERKLYEYLLSQNIQTTRQAKFDWCKNEDTGKHLPFDFVIEDKRIIIEVDGLQHFEQVSNWQSPEETQSRDLLKMKLAQENGYTIIRIFQEDVLYDSYDWKTELMNALIHYDAPTCLYMSKDENRYCQYQPTTPSS